MHTNNYLTSDYQNFIALSRYARWKEDEQRREGWLETVERYFDYVTTYIKDTVQTQTNPPKKEIKPKKDEAIQQQQVVQKSVSKGSQSRRKTGGSKGTKGGKK